MKLNKEIITKKKSILKLRKLLEEVILKFFNKCPKTNKQKPTLIKYAVKYVRIKENLTGFICIKSANFIFVIVIPPVENFGTMW